MRSGSDDPEGYLSYPLHTFDLQDPNILQIFVRGLSPTNCHPGRSLMLHWKMVWLRADRYRLARIAGEARC